MGRGDLMNTEWDRLESFLPRGGARGGRWSDHRRVINGVLYQVRTGVQWRDLPERFGRGTNQVDPVLRKLVARLEEVVRSASAWDVPAADSPPRSTSLPTGDAGPPRSS